MNDKLESETLRQFRIIIGMTRRHFRSLEDACGVSGAHVWILSAISSEPGIKVSQLSEKLSIHVSTASNMLNKLAKAELIERFRNEQDRRVVTLQLTKKGMDTLSRAPQPLSGLVPHALKKLPRETLVRLHEDLASLIREMNYVDSDSADKLLSDLVG